MPSVLQPAFITGRAGQLLVTCFEPAAGAKHWLLFVPPFAEEANKSRRMMARLGHALAAQGVGTALLDLFGTGDSAGDFGEARLAIWQDDIVATANWLVSDKGCDTLSLGGLRLGVAVGLSAISQLPAAPRNLLCWQPVTKGQQQLTQFLRLRQAAAVMGGGTASIKDMQTRLASGETLEVAGYDLHPDLASGLAQLDLNRLTPPSGAAVHWLELTRNPEKPVMPASLAVLDAWQQSGLVPQVQGVPGDPFWTVQELVDAPALVDASVQALRAKDAA